MAGAANSINESSIGLSGFTGTAFVGTAVSQFNLIVGGNTSSTIANIPPSATSGIPLVSAGNSANPLFTTAVVAGGGTGNTTFTAYSVICAGTTATGAFQNVSGVGTAGQVLTSQGASALPQWAAATSQPFTWTDEATSFNAANAHGYFITATSTATLPASPSQGNTIIFMNAGAGASGLVIQANTGQTIIVGSGTSTSAGSATSNASGDSITLVYQNASTTWYAYAVQGTFTLA